MKKVLALVIATIMAVSTFALTTVCAFAADTVKSPTATTAASKEPTLQVNGSVTDTEITYSPDPSNPNKITFTFTGDGEIIGWETNLDDLGFVEGEDYTAVMNDDGTYTITFLSDEAIAAWENGEVIVNAIVDYEDEEDETTTASSSSETTTSANTSSTSPKTGYSTAVLAGGVAVAGAGVAVLALTKKRDSE